MKWELRFHPDVGDEVAESYEWYEDRLTGLGEEFLAALEACYARLVTGPAKHQIIEGDIRHSRLRRFPFAVYYRIVGDAIEVVAVHHDKRDPEVWRSRVSD